MSAAVELLDRIGLLRWYRDDPKDWSAWCLDREKEQHAGKVGLVVEMSDGETYLIGDINELRGVCDDCAAFRTNKTVVAWAEIARAR